jgi:hypothetical protein
MAARNLSSLALEGLLKPVIFLTNCSEAARISSSVTGGSKLNSVFILRHIAITSAKSQKIVTFILFISGVSLNPGIISRETRADGAVDISRVYSRMHQADGSFTRWLTDF